MFRATVHVYVCCFTYKYHEYSLWGDDISSKLIFHCIALWLNINFSREFCYDKQ